ncbi:CopM family metallochaperone [Candidatus Raskinella chloraquaticus]|uniref:CopM family metallochaperone n=1 Tax=Candidatus Raskinella chloraquaticus TaxID=1951219 RepID=UPI00366B96F4
MTSVAVSLLSATASLAQNPHAGHGAHGAGAGQQTPMGDMDNMMSMMRQMTAMMERMRTASPAERERMMGAMTGPGHQGHGQTSAAAPPSTRAFEEANAKMHREMAIAFTGNADVDFVRGMIPHHQGAIDMARVVLQFGTNEQTKKWANEIIAAQEREIAEMREWLRTNAPQ